MPEIAHLLNRRASIQRPGQTPDGQGGFTEGLTEVATPNGRRFASSGNDRFVAGREEPVVTDIWYFEFGVDVQDGDTIVADGTNYEVLHVLRPSKDEHLKVKTREFQ